MGLEHSQPRPPRPKSDSSSPFSPHDSQTQSVVIDRSDVPEAYLHVVVSDDVVSRAKAHHTEAGGEEQENEKWREELAKERDDNAKLREQMRELKQLQQRHQLREVRANAAAPDPASTEATSPERMKELKKVFNDKVEEVQKRFFNYRRENACAENEKQIIACLAKNSDKVLNCRHLLLPYQQCISEFRGSVLSEKSQPSVVTQSAPA